MDKIEGLIMILVMSHQMGIIELLEWCRSIQKQKVIVVEIVKLQFASTQQTTGWMKQIECSITLVIANNHQMGDC
jgi:hypothetical protein